MNKLSFVVFALFAGCAQATVDLPKVCDVNELNFPGVPSVTDTIQPVKGMFTFSTGFGKDLLTKVTILNGSLSVIDTTSNFIDEIKLGVADPNGGDEFELLDEKNPAGSVFDVVADGKNLVSYIDSKG